MIDSEHAERAEDDTDPESIPSEDDLEHNLPGTPDENAEGLVDGVAEGE